MRLLSELHPEWIGVLRPGATSGEGVTFDCPKCGPNHRLVAYFSNPLDGAGPAPWHQTTWLRGGEDLAKLTISPSLVYPCWHGWVELGHAIPSEEGPGAIVDLITGAIVVRLSPLQLAQAYAGRGG